MFMAMAIATCSIWHGLCLAAVLRLTLPCIPSGSLNQLPASAGGKDGNVTSAGWQVTLYDPIWHVSSRSGEAVLLPKGEPLYFVYLLLLYFLATTRRSSSTSLIWLLSMQCRISHTAYNR